MCGTNRGVSCWSCNSGQSQFRHRIESRFEISPVRDSAMLLSESPNRARSPFEKQSNVTDSTQFPTSEQTLLQTKRMLARAHAHTYTSVLTRAPVMMFLQRRAIRQEDSFDSEYACHGISRSSPLVCLVVSRVAFLTLPSPMIAN